MFHCFPVGAESEDNIWREISQMTLREKVGQLFVIRPDALEGRFSAAELEDNKILGPVVVTEEMREMFKEHQKSNCRLGEGIINMPEIKITARE